MKRFLMILVLMFIAAVPSLAQSQDDLITLNDATPAIDVSISLPPDATGTISLNLSNAAVTIKTEDNTVVFYAADERIHSLDFNIAPNTGTHTLTVERLTGYSEAHVTVMSLPELAMYGSAEIVADNSISLNQEADLALSSDHPGETVAVSIPEGTTGVVTASFPGANAASQLVDSRGLLIAQSSGGHIDGLNFALDAGQYHFTVRANNLTDPIVAGVRAVSTEVAGLQVLEAPITNQTISTMTGTNCTGVVLYSSVNLRSGPGTGYSVLDYGYHDDAYPVGGQNPQSSWVVIGLADGSSAWVSRDTISLQGNCSELAVFDIPLREAQPAQIIISAPSANNTAPVVSAAPANSTSGYHDDDDDDHYEHERDEHEHDDDD